MSYLIDTNVLSELKRKKPDGNVIDWVMKRPASTLYLSVLTLGEIRKGIENLQVEERKLVLLDWLETELPNFFFGRILPIDARIADCWGHMAALAKRPLPAIDSLIAATASCHNLSVVTRNTRDYEMLGVKLINPWQD